MKEQVYDVRIHPLMAQILDICKESGIAMIAHFEIGSNDDEGLCVTSLTTDENGELSPTLRAARQIVKPSPLMVTTRNGAGQVTKSEVIL